MEEQQVQPRPGEALPRSEGTPGPPCAEWARDWQCHPGTQEREEVNPTPTALAETQRPQGLRAAGIFPPTLRREFLHPAPLGVGAQGYVGMLGLGCLPRVLLAAHGQLPTAPRQPPHCGLLGKTRGLREPARKPHSERGSLRPREESVWSMPPPPPTSTTRASPRHG